MTITTIRKKLIDYLEDADADKVKAVYKLLENDIEEQYSLTEEQWGIVEREKANYLQEPGKSYSRQEAHAIITGNN